MNQNFLIQTSGIICFIVSGILFLGWPFNNVHKTLEIYCSGQALFLNYCFISIHAHFSFIMWNNLALAMGWKFLGIKDPAALVGLMFFISIAIPIVPTIIILAYILDSSGESKNVFLKKYFFCVVNEPSWRGYRIWFILLSFPGIVAACILFYKTIESRRKMLQFSNTSQFSKLQLLRMFFALIAYLVASVLSIFMGLITQQDNTDDELIIQLGDFMPAGLGFLLFITYGFGSAALEFYKKVYIRLGSSLGVEVKDSRSSISSRTVISPKRRNSSIKSLTDLRGRRSSQLSDISNEKFIYDEPELELEFVENENNATVIKKPVKINRVRRGSNLINRQHDRLDPKKHSIEMIPEVSEDEDEEEIDA